MSIQVVFGKNGFYHPAYGRMGRGEFRGFVYTLPDEFKAKGMLPKSAKIIEDESEMEEVLEANDQTKPIKAKVVDTAQFEKNVKPAKKASGSSKEPLE